MVELVGSGKLSRKPGGRGGTRALLGIQVRPILAEVFGISFYLTWVGANDAGGKREEAILGGRWRKS